MLAYLSAIGIVALIYCLLSLGLNLQFGLTRLVNFGVVAFFAIGAYTSGLLALKQGLPLPVTFTAAALAAALCALPIGLLSLRLRDDYLAIVTLGFSEAVRIAIQQERWLTNGVQGLPGLPKLFAGLGGSSDVAILLVLLALVGVVAWGTVRLTRSPFGRLLKAIGDDEVALAALGKDPARFKVQVFMLGAALAGLAGAFYAHFITFITPEQFIPLVTFYVWMGLVMGGTGSVRGALAGAGLLMLFLEGSRFAKDWIPGVTEVGMASLRLAAVGLALILVTLYRPEGLFGSGRRS